MSSQPQDVIEATAPNEEEIFYADWGREMLKGGYDAAKDALRQLMTLDTFLIGGTVALIGSKAVSLRHAYGWAAVLVLFASLVVAFWGIVPRQRRLCTYAPYDVREFQAQAMTARLRLLVVAGALCGIGLILASLGVFLGTPNP